ncbi:MAG: hypothetical protein COB36_09180 [Alphaproteobacteria bacterium]|nr:MAG: hypothetical protein COB36_09180 [Alphaproteobacteria bacterium]
MFGASFWSYNLISNEAIIAIHWDVSGEADRYVSKRVGLFFPPFLAIFFVLVLSILAHLEPRSDNLKKSRKALTAVITVSVVTITILHLTQLLSLTGYDINTPQIVLILMGGMLIVVGNYMGKTRSNYLIGFRTPWSLSSEESWNKTHRVGGVLFFIVGLITIISSFILMPKQTGYILATGLISSVIYISIYSWFVWRKDPNKK